MPSTAFGPLVEPGWPDLRGGADIAGHLMSGMQLTANIRARQEALEAQMMENALANRQHELDREQRGREFDAKLGLLNDANQRRNDIYGLNLAKFKRLQNKDINQATAKQALFQAQADMENEGWKKYQNGYMAELSKRVYDVIGDVPNNVYNKFMGNTQNDVKVSATLANQNYKIQKKAFEDKLSQGVFNGSLNISLDPIRHPDDLPDQPVEKKGWNFSMSPMGAPILTRGEGKPTGKKMVTYYDARGNKQQNPVDLDFLKELGTQWNELETMRKSIQTTPQPSASIPVPPPATAAPPQAQGGGLQPGDTAYVGGKKVIVRGRNPQTGKLIVEDAP